MKNLKKVVALLLCAILLVAGSVMGTLAYLTAQDTVLNTFTVGDVQIKLDEADVNPDGTYVTNHDNRVQENSYKLLPGHDYYKDPTVWVEEGSERAYIRMIVTVNSYDQLKLAFTDENAAYDDGYVVTSAPDVKVSGEMVVLDYLVDRNSAVWQCVSFTENTTEKTGTYEFRYFPGDGTYTAAADNGDAVVDYYALPDLFTQITVPDLIDNTHLGYLNNVQIKIDAHAIQADGFDTADEAWAAFQTQQENNVNP